MLELVGYLWFWGPACPLVQQGASIGVGGQDEGKVGGLGWASTEKVGAVHGLPAYPGFWACVASSGTGASTRIVGRDIVTRGGGVVGGRLAGH